MRKGDKYFREIEVLKSRFIERRQTAIPTRIRVFGLEWQLVQPIQLSKYQKNDPLREKRSVPK